MSRITGDHPGPSAAERAAAPEQTQLADQGAPASSGPCAWCGETTSLKLTLRKGSNKGAKALKMAYEVWCCATHQRTLQLRGEGA